MLPVVKLSCGSSKSSEPDAAAQPARARARYRALGRYGYGVALNVGTVFLFASACTDIATPGSKLSDVLEGVESPEFLVESATELAADDDLYAAEHLPVLRITLEPEAEAHLAFEPREYVPAMLELTDGDVIESGLVGLKLKGNGSFRTLEAKAALRIKVDKYRDDQTLRGRKALTLNNMVQDRSLMAERLAYFAFRQLGAPAPKANHAQVYINDVYYGVYANLETPNEDFLAQWFEDPGRSLYEQAGRDFDHPDAAWSFELETRGSSDRERLIALQAACSAFDLGRARELVDWPKFLLFSALEAAVNQVDGYSYAQTLPNNYRIYDSESGIVFIPWGLDWAFADVATHDGGLFVDPLWLRPTHGVLMRMCLADQDCTSEYLEVIRHVAERWDGLELEARMDEWSAQIDEAFLVDKRREVSVEAALESREIRREVIRGRAEALLAATGSRDGDVEIPVP